jgi:hypothetical protein
LDLVTGDTEGTEFGVAKLALPTHKASFVTPWPLLGFFRILGSNEEKHDQRF